MIEKELEQKFKEDSKVWFADYDTKNGFYAEYGYVRAKRQTDNYYIVEFYAGMLTFNEEELYFTKEDCEKAINEEMKDNKKGEIENE